MDRNLKIGLYSVGGLIIATGLFFGIRALIKAGKGDMSDAEKEELKALRKKEKDGTLSKTEETKLNELEGDDEPNIPGPGETTIIGGISFPLKNGSQNKAVAQIQLAINEKHNNNQEDYKYGYCCTGNDQKLLVDGNLGGKTAKALKKYYDMCCKCEGSWYTAYINQTCNCLGCSISKSHYNSIITGADTSDTALTAAGYDVSSNFSGYSNFNVPGYGRKQSSVLGDFYKGKYDFVDDNREKGPLKRNYGMGLFFSGE